MIRLIALTLVVWALLAGCPAWAERYAGPSGDELIQPDQQDETQNSYRHLLTMKLGVTSFDCGRVVDTPSFDPETMVSVYSRQQEGISKYYVTLVKAQANLWQRTNSLRNIEKARIVGIQRVDAEITQTIAESIKKIWLTMIRGAGKLRHQEQLPSGEEFVFSGYLEFSIEHSRGPSVRADLWTPPQGPKTRILKEVFDNLWKYCEASTTERKAIAAQIDRDTKRLLTLLGEDGQKPKE